MLKIGFCYTTINHPCKYMTNLHYHSCAIVQAVSRQLPTMVAQVGAQITSCEICVVQSGIVVSLL
jgi:hypothetical protein